MWFLLIGLFVVIFILVPQVRCFIFNLPSSIFLAIIDIKNYLLHKLFNTAPFGYIDCYCAEFGGGKTLSVTSKICNLYKKYDGKKVWHPELKKMVTQKIQILSNVELVGVPYIKLVSMEQFIKACEVKHDEDIANNTLTITYLLGDEFSSQMNSRNFKTNIPTSLLNKILTSRHYYSAWYITSQRFSQVDKLIRESCRYVVECSKTWRFLINDRFYAWEMENCNNPLILEPVDTCCLWVSNKMYNQYNTYSCVENLSDDWKNGKYLDDKEVLELRQPTPTDTSSVHLRKRFLHKQKRA